MTNTQTANTGRDLNALKVGDTFYRNPKWHDAIEMVVIKEDTNHIGEVICEFTDKSHGDFPESLNFGEWVVRINEAN